MNNFEQVERYGRAIAKRQRTVERTSELWTTGRKGCSACIGVSVYRSIDGDAVVATGEADQLTAGQMIRALKTVWPDWKFKETPHPFGYIRIDGSKPK